MAPPQNQNTGYASRELPVKTQTHDLDKILDTLHTKYSFPALPNKRHRPVTTSPSRPAVKKRESYVEKLKSLLESDPQRVEYAMALLDSVANEPGNILRSKGGSRKLVMRFEQTLDDELSKAREISSDRDLSLLQLLGTGLSEAGGTKHKAHTIEKQGADMCEYEGRFDDPVSVCHSPANSVGRRSPNGRRETEGSGFKRITGINPVDGDILKSEREAHLGELSMLPNVPRHQHQHQFLSQIEAHEEMVTDTDGSEQSFYSCHGAPSQSESIEAGSELDTSTSKLLSPDHRSTIPTAQRPHRIASHFISLGTIQNTSHLRSSVFVDGGKRPRMSKLPLRLGIETPRGFSSSKHQMENNVASQGPILASFNTTSSAQSSFNTSSCLSTTARKDWSPLTSAYASSNEVEDVGTLVNHKIKPKNTILDFSANRERIHDKRLLGELETPYNGDLDSDATDVDDPEIGIITPLKRHNRKPRKEGSLAAAKINGSKNGEKHTTEDEDEGLRRLAEDIFGKTPEESLDSQIAPTVEPFTKDYKEHLVIGKCGEAQKEVGISKADGSLVDGWLSDQSTWHGKKITTDEQEGGQEGEHSQEPWEDDNEFGSLDDEFLSNPALKPTTHPLQTLNFSVQYEATRVALDQKIYSNKAIYTYLNSYCDDLYEAKEYQDLWRTLTRFSKEYSREKPNHISNATKSLEQTSESVWIGFKKGLGWPDNVCLTGKLHYGEAPRAFKQDEALEKYPLTVTLKPLIRTCGNRFFNRFGADRFLTLRLPSLQNVIKGDLQKVRGRIIDWLVEEELELMNRTWKCFYIKGDRKSKRTSASDKTITNESFNQAVFFATKGVGIGTDLNEQQLETLGFRKDDRKLRQEMSVEELLMWHIRLEGNMNMTVAKFWSRISLGFSDAIPTVIFKPSQILFIDDIKSPTGNVMDDGCSVASPAVMELVRQKLGYDFVPTAVQARLGGAKGIWMLDPEGDWKSEEIYIKVTKSQLKYKGYDNDEDWARLTLEVLDASHDPIPATINTQLIPILEDRGVPFTVFKELLNEHLEWDLQELFQVVDKPVELRRWMYDRGNVAKGRVAANTVATSGAIPVTKQEIAILLLESGFLVRECSFLMKQVGKVINQYCEDLKAKLHIRSHHSTRIFCVADPTRTLEEGEVSLRFSKGILDPKILRRSTVITGDILVARNPAHLPSDIQKVKAVDIQSHHSPRLKELQDVIVFSVKGDKSLASLLSGGDYDGDKPWVCWDERIVKSFKNSEETFDEYEEQIEQYFKRFPETVEDLKPYQPGFSNRFFRAGISSSIEESFLGLCTSAWEKFCYKTNGITDPTAIELAKICSFLVDAPKQGLSIIPSKKEAIMKGLGRLPKPAYKDPRHQVVNYLNILDRLHFDVARHKVTEMQTAFHKDFRDARKYESELTVIYRREEALAKGDEALRQTLKHLRDRLRVLREDWSEQNNVLGWEEEWGVGGGVDEFKVRVSNLYRQFREIKPPGELSQDRVIGRWISDGDSYLSYWSLLRASAAYSNWTGSSTLVWHMAGRELCFIKSQASGRKSDFGTRTMTEEMYIPLKTSRKNRNTRKVEEEEEDNT